MAFINAFINASVFCLIRTFILFVSQNMIEGNIHHCVSLFVCDPRSFTIKSGMLVAVCVGNWCV